MKGLFKKGHHHSSKHGDSPSKHGKGDSECASWEDFLALQVAVEELRQDNEEAIEHLELSQDQLRVVQDSHRFLQEELRQENEDAIEHLELSKVSARILQDQLRVVQGSNEVLQEEFRCSERSLAAEQRACTLLAAAARGDDGADSSALAPLSLQAELADAQAATALLPKLRAELAELESRADAAAAELPTLRAELADAQAAHSAAAASGGEAEKLRAALADHEAAAATAHQAQLEQADLFREHLKDAEGQTLSERTALLCSKSELQAVSAKHARQEHDAAALHSHLESEEELARTLRTQWDGDLDGLRAEAAQQAELATAAEQRCRLALEELDAAREALDRGLTEEASMAWEVSERSTREAPEPEPLRAELDESRRLVERLEDAAAAAAAAPQRPRSDSSSSASSAGSSGRGRCRDDPLVALRSECASLNAATSDLRSELEDRALRLASVQEDLTLAKEEESIAAAAATQLSAALAEALRECHDSERARARLGAEAMELRDEAAAPLFRSEALERELESSVEVLERLEEAEATLREELSAASSSARTEAAWPMERAAGLELASELVAESSECEQLRVEIHRLNTFESEAAEVGSLHAELEQFKTELDQERAAQAAARGAVAELREAQASGQPLAEAAAAAEYAAAARCALAEDQVASLELALEKAEARCETLHVEHSEAVDARLEEAAKAADRHGEQQRRLAVLVDELESAEQQRELEADAFGRHQQELMEVEVEGRRLLAQHAAAEAAAETLTTRLVAAEAALEATEQAAAAEDSKDRAAEELRQQLEAAAASEQQALEESRDLAVRLEDTEYALQITSEAAAEDVGGDVSIAIREARRLRMECSALEAELQAAGREDSRAGQQLSRQSLGSAGFSGPRHTCTFGEGAMRSDSSLLNQVEASPVDDAESSARSRTVSYSFAAGMEGRPFFSPPSRPSDRPSPDLNPFGSEGDGEDSDPEDILHTAEGSPAAAVASVSATPVDAALVSLPEGALEQLTPRASRMADCFSPRVQVEAVELVRLRAALAHEEAAYTQDEAQAALEEASELQAQAAAQRAEERQQGRPASPGAAADQAALSVATATVEQLQLALAEEAAKSRRLGEHALRAEQSRRRLLLELTQDEEAEADLVALAKVLGRAAKAIATITQEAPTEAMNGLAAHSELQQIQQLPSRLPPPPQHQPQLQRSQDLATPPVAPKALPQQPRLNRLPAAPVMPSKRFPDASHLM